MEEKFIIEAVELLLEETEMVFISRTMGNPIFRIGNHKQKGKPVSEIPKSYLKLILKAFERKDISVSDLEELKEYINKTDRDVRIRILNKEKGYLIDDGISKKSKGNHYYAKYKDEMNKVRQRGL